jgi:hypothetical protein
MAVYRELCDLCNCEGSIPADLGGLASAAGCTVESIERIWPIIRHKFDPTRDGKRLTQRNATVELRRAQEFSRLQALRASNRDKNGAGIHNSNNSQDNPADVRLAGMEPDASRNGAIRVERVERTNKKNIGRAAPTAKEIIAEFQAMPAYSRLNVSHEWDKCVSYYVTKRRRQPTKSAFLSWLLRADSFLPFDAESAERQPSKRQEWEQ